MLKVRATTPAVVTGKRKLNHSWVNHEVNPADTMTGKKKKTKNNEPILLHAEKGNTRFRVC